MPTEYLPAFTDSEVERLRTLMAAQVISMRGRKLEEGDWTAAYCEAKGVPLRGWSNLDIDVIAPTGIGVEHKMIGTGARRPAELYGARLMHPALTRAIRIPSSDDPMEVMTVVLSQYGELVESRARQVEQETGQEADLRIGWLLWQGDLSQFLYFEERMVVPDPNLYYAEWNEIQRTGRRRGSRNLWIFERESNHKRYSVTTSAGAKIQPYFDVPGRESNFAYPIVLEGETADGEVLVWVTPETRNVLSEAVGSLDSDAISQVIIDAAARVETFSGTVDVASDPAVQIRVTEEAYDALATVLPQASTSDERIRSLLSTRR